MAFSERESFVRPPVRVQNNLQLMLHDLLETPIPEVQRTQTQKRTGTCRYFLDIGFILAASFLSCSIRSASSTGSGSGCSQKLVEPPGGFPLDRSNPFDSA